MCVALRCSSYPLFYHPTYLKSACRTPKSSRHLGGILATEGTATMGSPAAIGVDDDPGRCDVRVVLIGITWQCDHS